MAAQREWRARLSDDSPRVRELQAEVWRGLWLLMLIILPFSVVIYIEALAGGRDWVSGQASVGAIVATSAAALFVLGRQARRLDRLVATIRRDREESGPT